MTTQRILLLSYIVLGVLIALVLQHLLGGPVSSIPHLGFFSHSQLDTYLGDMSWGLVVGSAASLGLAIYCWFSPKVRVPATQVIEELQRVTWPSWPETKAAAVAVVVASAICAVLLGAFDYGWGAVTRAIYAEASGTSQTTQNQ